MVRDRSSFAALIEAVAYLAELTDIEEAALQPARPRRKGAPLEVLTAAEMFAERSPPGPMQAALKALLHRLPRPTLIKLVVVMYAGRGDGDFKRAPYAYFSRTFGSGASEGAFGPADKLLSKSALAAHLRKGLERAEREGFDLDRPRWR
jgi:hypothetical protein